MRALVSSLTKRLRALASWRALGIALMLLVAVGFPSWVLMNKAAPATMTSPHLVTSGPDDNRPSPGAGQDKEATSDPEIDPRIAAQLPLADASSQIQRLWWDKRFPNFTGVRLNNDRGTVVLYWKGPLPPEMTVLVENLRANVPIEVIDSPYSLSEFQLEARRLAGLDPAATGVNVTEAGPLPDFSGLRVAVKSAEQLNLARQVIQSPIRLEFVAAPMGQPTPTVLPRQVNIAPGVALEPYANGAGGLLYTRDGKIAFDGDGAVNYCYFHTEEGRQDLEGVLTDEDAMQRVRAYLKEWGLSGRRLQLPHALSMRAPAAVQPGMEAVLKVSIYSNSDCPVEYTIGKPAFDFAVTRLDGTEVWRWSRGRETGQSTALRLGKREERSFEAAWDLRDNEGRSLPEGAYWVQGYLNIGLVRGQEPLTGPVGKRLLFIGPPLSFTHWLDVWLEAPPTPKLGEPVPLALKVRNGSSEPVGLFHGEAPYDFVVLSEDGSEVWRWSRWRVFPSVLRHTTIQPGETLTYNATWDQHDQDCQPDPGVYGRPCQGKPVTPGKYVVRATFEAALSDSYVEYKEMVQPVPLELVIKPH
ncbi:MAG: hypothetical protein HYY01_11785 [Chloroflexi bacterium]|nr:hypothetical protein [Chloroflexota bacterium]